MTIFKRLWRMLFKWTSKKPTDEELKKVELIVTQAYSMNSNGSPGLGNLILSATASDYCSRLGIKAFPQAEVSFLPKDMIEGVVRSPSRSGKSDRNWNSFTVAKAQADYCRLKGIKTVLVVAHPIHMNRAVWIYERLGLRAIPAEMPRCYAKYQGPLLVHFSARHHWSWFFLRELLIARPLFFLQGKI